MYYSAVITNFFLIQECKTNNSNHIFQLMHSLLYKVILLVNLIKNTFYLTLKENQDLSKIKKL